MKKLFIQIKEITVEAGNVGNVEKYEESGFYITYTNRDKNADLIFIDKKNNRSFPIAPLQQLEEMGLLKDFEITIPNTDIKELHFPEEKTSGVSEAFVLELVKTILPR